MKQNIQKEIMTFSLTPYQVNSFSQILNPTTDPELIHSKDSHPFPFNCIKMIKSQPDDSFINHNFPIIHLSYCHCRQNILINIYIQFFVIFLLQFGERFVRKTVVCCICLQLNYHCIIRNLMYYIVSNILAWKGYRVYFSIYTLCCWGAFDTDAIRW